VDAPPPRRTGFSDGWSARALALVIARYTAATAGHYALLAGLRHLDATHALSTTALEVLMAPVTIANLLVLGAAFSLFRSFTWRNALKAPYALGNFLLYANALGGMSILSGSML
jgi:hypothetical protein